jgi:ATP-binding cassette, subfamily B, bacterial
MAETTSTETFTLQEYFSPLRGKRLRRFPHLVGVAFSIVWTAAKRELFAVIALQALTAAGLAGELLLVRSLLEHIIGHKPHFGTIIPQLAGLSLITLTLGTVGTVLGLRSRMLAQLVAKHAIDGVIRTATSVDLITFDDPAFHDRLQRAQASATTRPAQMVQEMITAGGALLSIAGIGIALILIQPLFCLLVLVAYIPVWFVTNRAGRLGYRQTVEQTELERMRRYLAETLTSKQPAQEVRAFDTGGFLGDRQNAIYQRLLDEIQVVMRRRMKLALTGQALSGILTAGALAVLVWFVTSGRMSLSAAGSAAGAMVLLGGRLHGFAGGSAGLYENSLYLEDYVSFVAAAPRIVADRPTTPADRPPEVLTARGLSFTYPSRTQPSLSDASLTVRRGEVVALVGENGSGKTTFAKLLAGLFSPREGTVAWDGTDIATLDPLDIRRHTAIIFQDFVRYLLPAHDNIALGDPRHFDDRERVERAARAAGIHDMIASLRHGYDTILGPAYYGGSDLSGGQWQRVALARLFFRDAPIVMLDEPTASLDPRAEAELYESMRSLFAGRAVLLITHRFASARTADRIYVLRNGRIVEEGTHAELIATDGYYAELFELQASQFRD